MKVRTGGRVVEIPDERIAGDRLSGGHRRGAGDVGAAHERRASGTNTSLVKSGGRTTNPTNALPGWPKPSDKWNWAYAQFLELEKQAGRVKWWWYEPLPFGITLGGAEKKLKYRPDFLVWYPDGLERKLEFVEVKGWSRNRRDGITRYKIAAALFPCFDWKMVERKGHGWEECCS